MRHCREQACLFPTRQKIKPSDRQVTCTQPLGTPCPGYIGVERKKQWLSGHVFPLLKLFKPIGHRISSPKKSGRPRKYLFSYLLQQRIHGFFSRDFAEGFAFGKKQEPPVGGAGYAEIRVARFSGTVNHAPHDRHG